MIDKIQDIAIVIRSNFKLEDQGIEFITDNESTQQVGIMRRPKDYKVKDHIHLKQPGRKAVYTQEALLVRSGQIRVDLFKEDEFGIKFAKSVTLEQGDEKMSKQEPIGREELPECVDTGLRMRLRSVYLKGHQDGNLKTADLSWEDKIVNDIVLMFRNWKKEL